jgi:hypothetical protein
MTHPRLGDQSHHEEQQGHGGEPETRDLRVVA